MAGHRELIVLMGPSACGKTTISGMLGEALSAPVIEGDDHHPPANKRKMAAGTPLTDEDRAAWIDSLAADSRARPDERLVLACSALTAYVQDRLRSESGRSVRFVLLDLPRDVLAQRLAARTDHFMPVSLLDSQLAALDPPADVLRVDATMAPSAIVEHIRAELNEQSE
ncbi:gluconokinase [Qipengyuania proteolytica]|uniref:gluconokinase n=1 Tax=Qipengyuania proteolytica TaxID=2867239 RepID=UPI001FFCB16F|nr:gluconokinase, GntK/IdnK-type [Qipengyuania proteolytica]